MTIKDHQWSTEGSRWLLQDVELYREVEDTKERPYWGFCDGGVPDDRQEDSRIAILTAEIHRLSLLLDAVVSKSREDEENA